MKKITVTEQKLSARAFRFGPAPWLAVAVILCSLVPSKATDQAQSIEPKPRIYLTTADVARLRQQATRPELAAAYADLEAKTKRSVDAWLKKYPATASPRSTEQ